MKSLKTVRLTASDEGMRKFNALLDSGETLMLPDDSTVYRVVDCTTTFEPLKHTVTLVEVDPAIYNLTKGVS